MLPTDLLEKAMRPAFLGIIGCGAMGRLIARHVREQLPSYRLGGLFSRTTAHAEGLALELGDVPVLGLQQLIETCDLLVEATSAAAMPDIVRACLAAGKAVVAQSSRHIHTVHISHINVKKDQRGLDQRALISGKNAFSRGERTNLNMHIQIQDIFF